MSTTGAIPFETVVPADSSRANFADLGLRALIYSLLYSAIFVPEFPHIGSPSLLYEKAAFGFRVIDLAIFPVALAHLGFFACLRGRRLRFPRSLVIPGSAFLLCIAASAIYGASRGGTNFFFDWRGLALGIPLYVIWAFWLQDAEDIEFAVRCFATYVAVRLLLLYIAYEAGYRDTLFGSSIPLFDGPTLSAIVFTTLLALIAQQSSNRLLGRVAWMALAMAGGLMVLLCMRRTYWIELGIGVLILCLLRQRHRVRNLVILTAFTCVVGLMLGSTFQNRVESLDVTRSDTPYSADNADHLYDLYDAWYQVQRSPIFGIGLGTSYETWHIRNWKSESVMVHNAPLHVWLKYGLAGLACYVWFHLVLLRWLNRQARAVDVRQTAIPVAALSFLTAQFVVTLGFAPWPYSELQLTVLTSFLLAAVVALSMSAPSQYA